MSCKTVSAIDVQKVSKTYQIYEKPVDRLKQLLWPTDRKFYREFPALKNISFSIKRGETVGIIGRNGSGKSTLLQLICGTLHPSIGNITLNGRVAALLELGAGFNPDFSGRENVYLNAAILGLNQNEIDERFDSIAEFSGLGDFIEQPVKTYSSGMYVRLAFATAINVDPDILIIDEALSVGDEAFQRKCFARIEQIQNNGATILFVSHSASAILQLCSQAMMLDRGELILEGTPKTVVSQYQRFMNLTGADIEPARDKIKAMDGWADGIEESEEGLPETLSDGSPSDAIVSTPEESIDDLDESWYDKNLVSKSQVEYVSKGARIRDMRILNMSGEIVNNLQTGRTYTYEYWVDFDKDMFDVGFGMGVLTLKGFSFGGANTYMSDDFRIPVVKKNASYHVKFTFVCPLRANTYVLNSGVMAKLDDGMDFITRILDAVIFRVMHEDIKTSGGYIDFKIAIDAQPIEAPAK